MTTMFAPAAKVGDSPSTFKSLIAIMKASWLNVLLVFIPVSWILHFLKANEIAIFVTSFFAIIPLAKLLGFATEELSLRVGETFGGLINATLGNAVELIVAIIALIQCKLDVVQSSLVGSILSNILLVLGMCFFAGGTRYAEQGFLLTAANLNGSLLILSVIAVLIPAAFVSIVDTHNLEGDGPEGSAVLKMSRGVALILLLIYGASLLFQIYTHGATFNGEGGENDTFKSTHYPKKENTTEDPEAYIPENGDANNIDENKSTDESTESPLLSIPVTLGLLVAITVLVAVTAEFLVDSIDGVTDNSPLSEQWVGLILLPIVGNAAEHVTAVTVSVKDKLTLSLGVAVGSSIQIALFVIPFITLLAWILDKPLTLLFDPLQSVVLFLSIITVNYCIQDGKSNWLEGVILMGLYVIIAVTFWFYPGTSTTTLLGFSTCAQTAIQ